MTVSTPIRRGDVVQAVVRTGASRQHMRITQRHLIEYTLHAVL